MAAISLDRVQAFGRGVFRSEGVVVDRDGFVWGAGRNGVVYRVSPDDRVEQVATVPAGCSPNGITLDRNGDLIICDVGPGALLRMTPAGDFSLIADTVAGVRLKTPNFPTFDAEGNLYVTNTLDATRQEIADDRSLGYDPAATGALVRIRPDGRGEVVARGIHWANGTAIDPQGEAIFVLQTIRRNVLRVPIRKDGSHGAPELFSEDFPGCPDGMAMAADGSFIVTLPGVQVPQEEAGGTHQLLRTASKIIRVDIDGRWALLIDDPDKTKLDFPTNCAFGGPDFRDLFIANLETDHLSRTTLDVAGWPLYHQR